jgi:hypothetical protein
MSRSLVKRSIITLMLWLGLSASALAGESAVLVMREGVSVEPDQRAGMAAMFRVEFEKYGVEVLQVMETADVKAAAAAAPAGARVFVLDAIRLGSKFLLKLGEFDAAGRQVFGEQISAAGMEELDLVTPRVVKAVLLRKNLEETQTVENLTRQEGRQWNKKWGEFYWGFGIPFAMTFNPVSNLSYGLNFKALYEMERLRIDYYLGFAVEGHGGTDLNLFDTDLSVNYLFTTGNFSPYLGGGVGFSVMTVNGSDFQAEDNGAHFAANAGVELFRLYGTRLLLGLRTILPLYQMDDDADWVYDPLTGTSHQEASGSRRWMPVFMTEVSFVW